MPVSAPSARSESGDVLLAQLHEERTRRQQAEARITELEQALQQARIETELQRTRLYALVRNLQIGVLLVDNDGRVVLLNQRFCEIFGLSESPAALVDGNTGVTLGACIQHNFPDPAAYVARATALRQAGRTVLNEEVVLTDGRMLERDYIVLDATMAGRLVCYRDVTKRYQREAQIRNVSHIPEQNPNPIMRLTAAGELIYANPAAAKLAQALKAEDDTLKAQLLALVAVAIQTEMHQSQEITTGAHYYLLTVVPVPGQAYATLYLTDITAQRAADRQLADQQGFYEAILNQLPADIGVFDTQHRYLFVNHVGIKDAALRKWIIGKDNFDYCAYRNRPTEIAEQRKQAFDEIIRDRKQVTYEESMMGPDGPRRLLRCLQPVFHPDGSVHMILAYGLDITERHQAQQQLAEQREFYETILNELSAGIAVFDPSHRYLFVNPGAIKDQEIRQWAIGKTDLEYYARRNHPQEAAAERRRLFDQAVQERAEVQWEESIASESGVRFILRRLRPVFGPDGALRLVIGTGLDITDRHLAEERHRQSEALVSEQQEFIRQIVDSSPNFLYVTDQTGDLLFTNATFRDLTERSLHLNVSLQDESAEAAEMRQLQEWHDHVLATGHDIMEEMSFTLACGEVRQLQVVKRPLRRPTGTIEVLTVATDITEFKRARREAEAAAHARENFLANMSHEIRTPMNGVLGMASLLARTPLNSQQREYVDIIRNSGGHLLGVLNDVLDVAKITSGKLELEHIPFDLNNTITKIGQTLAYRAAEKGIDFVISPIQLQHPLVVSDPQRLSQVLLNLLSNSIKFTEQGSICFEGALQAETDTTATISFRVIDTGMGVPIDKQEAIFASFAQAYANTTRRFGGTGLGLTISSSLVEQLGGRLVMCSEPGQGSTFSFTLTFEKAAAAAIDQVIDNESHTNHNAEQVRGMRVLLVEDHDVNRQLAQLVLANYDVQVDAVSDGPTALKLFAEKLYDIILMDIQMPGMSGLEVTAHMRQHPDTVRAQTPIIALTANAFRADNEKYLAAGLDECLPKPFEEAELLRKMLALKRTDIVPMPRLFDLDQLYHIAQGSAEFVISILDSFLATTPAALQQLQEAVAAADWTQAAALAHKIKPSLKLLNVHAFTDPIQTLEATVAAEMSRREAAQQIITTLPLVLSQIQDWLQTHKATAMNTV
ncbi:PAS domain-containing protein [Hymenobacter sp. BT491]|uniref:PAS domain-containing protein n=1 Tax=Hymenobacter sp. BT491 TaxID=2766779 RepID=UPI0016536187|nr:PAS domain-containing protein [Hymenobacter sp. BT491]MBC6991609.1 PAS domain-containing protein [Hymenobacter sp. BT491]